MADTTDEFASTQGRPLDAAHLGHFLVHFEEAIFGDADDKGRDVGVRSSRFQKNLLVLIGEVALSRPQSATRVRPREKPQSRIRVDGETELGRRAK